MMKDVVSIDVEFKFSKNISSLFNTTTVNALKLKDKPVDYSSLGGMQIIEEAGLKISEDISILSYDGIRISKYINLTTYKQDTTEIGKVAADKLIDDIESDDRKIEHVIIPGKLIVGGTVGKIN